jgi:hypothetical protein
MCGIFGFYLPAPVRSDWHKLYETLAKISESRGKEACGVSARHADKLDVLRWDKSMSDLVRQPAYKQFMANITPAGDGLAMIGHTRLVTNGDRSVMSNNQPVMRNGTVLIHNGIICNYAELWRTRFNIEPPSQLDSEILPPLMAEKSGSAQGAQHIFDSIEGDASMAALFENKPELLLATNTGSLYLSTASNGGVVFASQHSFLVELQKDYPEFTTITQMKPREARVINIAQGAAAKITETTPRHASIGELRRCTQCVLPHTMPGIAFDAVGVCNFCNEHVLFKPAGRDALAALCDKHRRSDGSYDCLVAFSGGRDSSYALHVLKTEMGMNPVTFTYDWGMLTDLARRNIARMCGKLGVENILVSADIPKKRDYIRMNVQAWLKKPELGMVSLFMAGDKQFFYHSNRIANELNIDFTMYASQRLEQTSFKTGFCGATERNSWYLYVGWQQKARMLMYFVKQYLTNPRYINRSLLDTAFSFYCAYALKNDFHVFYDYIPWDESIITDTLKREYHWETAAATDTTSTWRIGDGTAAFYNYIYLTMAGFTEHDTFRSTQIRQGMITRDKAMELLQSDNVVRIDAMKEYAHTVGFDLQRAMQIIEAAPRLY